MKKTITSVVLFLIVLLLAILLSGCGLVIAWPEGFHHPLCHPEHCEHQFEGEGCI